MSAPPNISGDGKSAGILGGAAYLIGGVLLAISSLLGIFTFSPLTAESMFSEPNSIMRIITMFQYLLSIAAHLLLLAGLVGTYIRRAAGTKPIGKVGLVIAAIGIAIYSLLNVVWAAYYYTQYSVGVSIASLIGWVFAVGYILGGLGTSIGMIMLGVATLSAKLDFVQFHN